MIRTIGGGLLALLLTAPAGAADLTATILGGPETGETEIARLEIPEGQGWCVVWNHSVQGFEVQDCYENRAGRMVLMRSHQPDYAAGLGHIIGRGEETSDDTHGYWIENIDEPVPGDAYILRPGAMAVDHRLVAAAGEVSLSALAEHARVRIALVAE
ncbi:DUF1850 domain-containing protein [Pseudoroseicyclus sp. CXY001]|uniref:DUF1850 domain-containing protein n=1 Tax=Pseudoroseicyclus sp. CXY001 TaxID=3242492 RepID=UPI003570BFDE